MKSSCETVGHFGGRVLGVHLFPGGLCAQGFGSINGTVTDSSGAVFAGAEVTATQAGYGNFDQDHHGQRRHIRLSHSVAFGLQHQRHARGI